MSSAALEETVKTSKELKEPQWLLNYRQKNEKIFRKRPLKKSQYFNAPKIEEILEKSNGAGAVLPKELEKNGLKVFSWQDALKKFPEKIRKILRKEHEPKDQFEAFTNSRFDSGFVITVGKNATTGKIVFESNFENGAIGKILIIVENCEKEFKVLEKIRGKEKLLLNETLWLGDGCKAALLRSTENSSNCTALLFLQTILEKDSTLLTSNSWISGSLVRSNTYNILFGPGSRVKQLDFMLLNDKQFFGINNTALHKAADSTSFTEIKSVMAGNSKSVFDGMIKILPSGHRTNAMLEAHSMLLGRNASSNNIPGLEIEADDVKAKHAASVAQILEEQVFYLETRGIKKDIAKHLIVISFLESIIYKLPKEFHNDLFSMLEQKMNQTR